VEVAADLAGAVLVFNAGSSSLKYALFEAGGEHEAASGTIDTRAHAAAVPEVLARLPAARIGAVGHRFVHGGLEFREGALVSPPVARALKRLSELAPLHNPPALAILEAAQKALPGLPQVAVFDTAFFADLPGRSVVYPLPWQWYEAWGVRRFGFHGLSHSWCALRAAELLARPAESLRLVSCHLGNGCSAAAVRGGKPIATTMGFTPLEGLMMGGRAGSVDPGILLWVLRHRGVGLDALDRILNHESGLYGVSGVSADFQEVQEAAASGNSRARLALEIYADRVRQAVGAMAAALGGLDALVFTAGVGEHSASLRASACDGLEFLGLRLDAESNARAHPDADVSAARSSARVLVLHAREELVIARETRRILSVAPAAR
jgi:acetate kinase